MQRNGFALQMTGGTLERNDGARDRTGGTLQRTGGVLDRTGFAWIEDWRCTEQG